MSFTPVFNAPGLPSEVPLTANFQREVSPRLLVPLSSRYEHLMTPLGVFNSQRNERPTSSPLPLKR